MPHLAPINWVIIWFFIWISFFIFCVIMWWKFKPFYGAPALSTFDNQKSSAEFWKW
uniref:ATP synthase complex subunit 8 n=1 Tax=Chrysomallon squamiferum TaxID=216257 RepID=S6BFN4_CHRSQ|nr:ATP synthase F0 subunit 8 [Chrysomallon squamiferum]